MGGPKRPTGDALVARVNDWQARWVAAAHSTAPADRPAAEAALAALYVADGRQAPQVLWVPSPVAGVLAYRFAALKHGRVRGQWARGDVGNGANREFNAIAAPFQMEPAWVHRTASALDARLPARAGESRRGWDPVELSAGRLGLGDATRQWRQLRTTLERLGRRPDLPVPEPDDAAVDAAGVVLGGAWETLRALVGEDLARDIFVIAIRRILDSTVSDRHGHREAIQAMQPGQWDTVAPVLAAARDVTGSTLWRHREGRAEREVLVEARLALAESAGPWWALDGLAIVSERPLVHRRDDRDRLHASDGPALAWPDGLELYAWHGVQVERAVVMDPGSITVSTIDREPNSEVRRVLIERFGPERLLREGNARLVSEDETGRLWRRELGGGGWGMQRDEALVMVEVVNSTPEPDGTHRTYWLRVPPDTRTAREGVAWTFNVPEWTYDPVQQT